MKIIFLSLVLTLQVFASQQQQIELSDDLRALLSQEMQYIKSGMNDIFEALISGEHERIIDIATNIQHSYIFKKKLTQEQREELKSKLSKQFIEYDREFHLTAQDLASFAEFDDKEEILNAYISMTKQCIRCHDSYAKNRFTNFQNWD